MKKLLEKLFAYEPSTGGQGRSTRQTFTASIIQKEGQFIAQCLEVDVASQGENEQEALDNLKEALELHFEAPTATALPKTRRVEISLRAAA